MIERQIHLLHRNVSHTSVRCLSDRRDITRRARINSSVLRVCPRAGSWETNRKVIELGKRPLNLTDQIFPCRAPNALSGKKATKRVFLNFRSGSKEPEGSPSRRLGLLVSGDVPFHLEIRDLLTKTINCR